MERADVEVLLPDLETHGSAQDDDNCTEKESARADVGSDGHLLDLNSATFDDDLT